MKIIFYLALFCFNILQCQDFKKEDFKSIFNSKI